MPDIVRPLDDSLRDQLIEAKLRHHVHPDPESKAEYLKAMKVFKDFVLYGKTPES